MERPVGPGVDQADLLAEGTVGDGHWTEQFDMTRPSLADALPRSSISFAVSKPGG